MPHKRYPFPPSGTFLDAAYLAVDDDADIGVAEAQASGIVEGCRDAGMRKSFRV
jgi:hypothetical protein